MKPHLLNFLCVFIAITTAHAEEAGIPVSASLPEGNPENIRLVKIATLNSVEANQEFQRNVKIMQAARENAFQLKAKFEECSDPDEKVKLHQAFEQAMESLNENNEKMIQHYGFSLNRNYIMVIERAHIYMQVTPEEAEQIKQRMDSDQKSPE